jgi:cytochrome c oxidase assembly factor CtaG/ferredoxin
MTSLDAALSSWSARPWLAAVLMATAAIYFRGWWALRRRDPIRWHVGKLSTFVGAAATIYVALASPIETFAPLLLTVHMIQHMLLIMVAPILIWLAAPMLPLLRGLPRDTRRYWIAPILRWRPLARLARAVVHPASAWIIFAATTWLWHLPGPYGLALADDGWHFAQHACFVAAGLIFWYPVILPFPSRPAAWSQWVLVPYLLLADVQNTLLAAWLTFSDRVLYPHYVQMPRLGGLTALEDQAAAGVTMWVPGSVVFLGALAWVGVRLMTSWRQAGRSRQQIRTAPVASDQPATSGPRPASDLLRQPIIGPLLRWPGTRRIAQFGVLLIVVAVIVDGLFGPQIGPMSLAGVVPWIHWRGIVIIGLLVAGNVFCYACPFMLPRTIARALFARLGKYSWPRWLRTKWLAAALLASFLWSYEALALWNSPWLTAWIAIAYFAGALVIDGFFREAAFCKYICPIGQFNFVQSLLSPWEIRVRQPAICSSCQTHDCIRGHDSLSGCELKLFQPKKVGNLDCTFCLDCVQACPHDNVGMIAVAPAANLWHDSPRSGIGRLALRVDYAALALLLVFGAFANAAGMTSPVVELQASVSESLDLSTPIFAITLFYLLFLVAVPATLVAAAANATRHLVGEERTISEFVCRFSWSLVPLGFAMWLAHYSFHFFGSYDTIVPVAQRFASDFHLAALGSPDWVCSCCRPAPTWLLKAELLMVDVGLLVSLYVAWRISASLAAVDRGTAMNSVRRTMRIVLPWAVLLLALFTAGVWILLQPMQMRGTMPGG